ncbi:MAG: hypothetical protein QNJ34_12185 [Xenococcaceae cyanobacterium MO_188.B29]|nr:hypothetical protein [Xenococcaceae cyanobacterium MO_188.B29]
MIIAGIKLLEEREKIYQGRFEELKREIAIAVEASERGEVIDGEIVFRQLEQKLRVVSGYQDLDALFIFNEDS